MDKVNIKSVENELPKNGSKVVANASSLAAEQHLRTITDVLTSRSQDYAFKLWEENIVGKPMDNVDGYHHIGNWFYIPYGLDVDKYNREFVKGILKTKAGRDDIFSEGLKLNVYDSKYVETIKRVLGPKQLSDETRVLIPDSMLRIDKAKMFYYVFPSPMFNKNQPRTWRNNTPRTISAINLLGIVQEDDGGNAVFYDGWDPQKRGEKIMKEFFVKGL